MIQLYNVKAERLNGKIQRFASNNYGLKDKDFSSTVLRSIFLSTSKKRFNQLFCILQKKIYLWSR